MSFWDKVAKTFTEATSPARAEQIRLRSEQRAYELMTEFPTLADADIAQLMHDELMNMRSPHREYYFWATAETVGRVRRNITLNQIRGR